MSFPYTNKLRGTFLRELQGDIGMKFQRSAHVTPDLIRRLSLEKELVGHEGCVNCLTWNERGTLLASGSDDVHVIIWDAFRYKLLTSIRTSHTGNIFSVKFLPDTNDSIIVSGAADFKIDVRDVNTHDLLHVFATHAGRVKRLATAPQQPSLFWSASEDGTVMQFDLRDPESCKSSHNVLIDLNQQLGVHAEAKCLSINSLRPELMAVGANDQFVRLYDRRMLQCRAASFPSNGSDNQRFTRRRVHSYPPTSSSSQEPTLESDTSDEEGTLPRGCVKYFVAGHLKHKPTEFKRKFRTLSCTYLTFSPDGNEILVNLGGEQIYLFDIIHPRRPQTYKIGSMGLMEHSNINGTRNILLEEAANPRPKRPEGLRATDAYYPTVMKKTANAQPNNVKFMPPAVDAIKQRANSEFEGERFNQAILLYNQAISMAPHLPILYGNRAAAFLKRNWDGDVYAALRDSRSAIGLDDRHIKAHFRLAKCLYELKWLDEALEWIQLFKNKFPDYANGQTCLSLEKDIRAAIYSKTVDPKSKQTSDSAHMQLSLSNSAQDIGVQHGLSSHSSMQEDSWRMEACDYEQRFCGHCNTTTDIKEANFFGSNGQYIVAGSDDGSFFIWDKRTANIVRILRGDDSIVNCLEPHPATCLLATSGIDPVVRLWSPKADDGRKDEREVDNSDDAASANQKRMNADPLEVMLMNMGYRIHQGIGGSDDEIEDEERDVGEQGGSVTACRSS